MIPPSLYSTYKQYKDDTAYIAEWLAETAQSCRSTSAILSGTKKPSAAITRQESDPRVQKRKNAKEAAHDAAERLPEQQQGLLAQNHIIPLKEFLRMAKDITTFEPPVDVPQKLITTAERCIQARERCNAYFTALDPATSRQRVTDGHQYFICTLKCVVEILRPRCRASVSHKLKSTHPPANDGEVVQGTNNIFANLHPEDTIDTSDNSTAEPREQRRLSESKVDTEPLAEIHIYEMEPMKDLARLHFALYCLFFDINKLRHYVSALWKSYAAKESELVSVAAVTNTAIDLVRKMEDEFKKEDFGMLYPKGLDVEQMMRIPYLERCRSKGKDPHARQKEEDFINMDCYDDADWFMLPVGRVLNYAYRCSMSLPGETPEDSWGTSQEHEYEPHHDRSRMSSRQKLDEDVQVLMYRLPYLTSLARVYKKARIAQDELTRGLGQMSAMKEIPLWFVFAAQCFLESHHALRDKVATAQSQLWLKASLIRNAADGTFQYYKDLQNAAWPKAKHDLMRNILIDVIDTNILEDRTNDIMQKLSRDMGYPELPACYVHRENPLLCGVQLLALQIHAQDIGINFANAWGSVQEAAHLYNAVRQEKVCKEWLDMEALIGIHSEERIFVGGRPSTPDQYMKHFLICLGYSATSIRPSKRSKGIIHLKRGPRDLVGTCPASQLFSDHFYGKSEDADRDLEPIEQFLNDKFESLTDWEAPIDIEGKEAIDVRIRRRVGKVITSAAKSERKLAPVELLFALHGSLEGEHAKLSFDYLSFHQKCWSLLEAVERVIYRDLIKYVGIEHPGDSDVPFVVGYILATAVNTDLVAREILKMKKVQVTSKLLHAAGRTLHHWIARCDETDRRRGRDGTIRDNKGRVFKDSEGLVVASVWK